MKNYSDERKQKASEQVFGALMSNNLLYSECCEVLEDILHHFQHLNHKTIKTINKQEEDTSIEDTYKFDGKAHVLSDNLGYILKKIQQIDFKEKTQSTKQELIFEYANYIYENNKEKSISFMIDSLNEIIDHMEEVKFVLRTPDQYSCLAQIGTLALKFKREPNDNLEGDN